VEGFIQPVDHNSYWKRSLVWCTLSFFMPCHFKDSYITFKKQQFLFYQIKAKRCIFGYFEVFNNPK